MKFNVKIVIETYSPNTEEHRIVEQVQLTEFDTLEKAKSFVESVKNEF